MPPPPYLRVKICGVTTPEDALLAESAGADAIGLIFASGSKRRVDLERAARISSAPGPFVQRVGVFVDASFEEVLQAVRSCRLDAVQLHGDEEPAYAAALRGSVRVIKAVRFSKGLRREVLERFPADAILLDGLRPGSGETFDWSEAAFVKGFPRLILAGGLTPETVADGVRALSPYAVDVASGVEAAPGRKDPAKVRRFVAAARSVGG